MGEFKQVALAKFNLWLQITGRREDGFHLLDSLVAFADFGEAVSGTPAKEWSLEIVGPEAGPLIAAELSQVQRQEQRQEQAQEQAQAAITPASPSSTAPNSNLVLRAAEAFHRAYGGDRFAFTLEKHLPMASGIGGGSADAAACLRLLAKAKRVDTKTADFRQLCLDLGADIPMCLVSKPALISGIGEKITPVTGLAGLFLVAVNPRQQVSTPEVFARYELPVAGERPADSTNLAPGKPQATTMAAWLTQINQKTNDLQAAATALCPQITEIVGEISTQPGCEVARMSGSGATVFGLFKTRDEAEKARTNLQAKWPDWWIKSAIPA